MNANDDRLTAAGGAGQTATMNMISRFPVLVLLLSLACQSSPVLAYDHLVLDYGSGDMQKVDLYLPDEPTVPVTLFVIAGVNWNPDPDTDRLSDKQIALWTGAGVRVAQVWYRPASRARFPAQAQDLAAAIAAVQDDLQQRVPGKQYLALLGIDAGAQLAALTALEPRYLQAAGVSPKRLAGVITISGDYDLAPDYPLYDAQRARYERIFGNEAQRRQASPVHLDAERVPPFLILVAEQDANSRLVDARRLTNHLITLGSPDVVRMLIRGASHDDLQQLDNPRNPAAHLVLDFLRLTDLEDKYVRLLKMERRWQQPPVSTRPFRDLGLNIERHPMNDEVRSFVKRAFLGQEYRLNEWPLQSFETVDLFELLDALELDTQADGAVLETTNVRGEKLFWKLDDLRPWEPAVVIGLDDEQNLFRVSSFYLGKREYSWEEPPAAGMPPMVRSLGAFIYFRKTPPKRYAPRYQAQMALTLDSFRILPVSPLDVFADLDEPLFRLITVDNGCTSCHRLRGVGAKAHHLTAVDMKPHGGYALDLESYAPDVWKRFIFDQAEVAALIGVSPNNLPEPLDRQLYQLVEDERP